MQRQRSGRARLIRLADGAGLDLTRVRVGARDVWVARSERDELWVPSDVMAALSVREPGDPFEAPLVPLATSARLSRDLLRDFLELPPSRSEP